MGDGGKKPHKLCPDMTYLTHLPWTASLRLAGKANCKRLLIDEINCVSVGSLVNIKGGRKGGYFSLSKLGDGWKGGLGCIWRAVPCSGGRRQWEILTQTLLHTRAAFPFGIKILFFFFGSFSQLVQKPMLHFHLRGGRDQPDFFFLFFFWYVF